MKIDSLDIRNGVLASLAGTIILSAIMVMKQLMGIVPQMNPIADLAGIAHNLLGVPPVLPIGWLLHFALGVFVWGTLFAMLRSTLPGSNLVKGLIFGIGAWFLMMSIFLPVAGQGFFGMKEGMVVPVMAFMLHLVYGAVLGFTYGKLSAN